MPLFTHPESPSISLSRRDFLVRVSAWTILLAAAVDPRRILAESHPALVPMQHWNTALFANRIGLAFVVNGGEAKNLTFQLLRVEDGNVKTASATSEKASGLVTECFILVFQAPRNQAIGQGTYEFKNDQFGKFLLFITPGMKTPEGQNYIAVFNTVLAGYSAPVGSARRNNHG